MQNSRQLDLELRRCIDMAAPFLATIHAVNAIDLNDDSELSPGKFTRLLSQA